MRRVLALDIHGLLVGGIGCFIGAGESFCEFMPESLFQRSYLLLVAHWIHPAGRGPDEFVIQESLAATERFEKSLFRWKRIFFC
jgi:hypothetical protein